MTPGYNRDSLKASREDDKEVPVTFSFVPPRIKMKELYLWPMYADQVGTPKQIRTVIDGIRKNNINVIFCVSASIINFLFW